MTRSTVALLAVGAAGAAGVWWYLRRKAQAAAGAPLAPPPPHPSAGASVGAKVSGAFDTFTNFQANAIGQVISSKLPIPATAKPAVSAGATDYVKYLTPVGQVGVAVSLVQHPVDTLKSVAAAPVNLVSKVGSALGFGSSKVCRASNNKDVFPNDMQMCAQLGITDCNSCGQLYNLQTGKWPWQ